MKRTVTAMLCIALGATLVPPALASIQKHEQRETKRIQKGARRGQLTSKETQRLLNQQSVIETERRQAMADGKMTKREHQDIRHDQKRLSHDIRHKRHNKKRAF